MPSLQSALGRLQTRASVPAIAVTLVGGAMGFIGIGGLLMTPRAWRAPVAYALQASILLGVLTLLYYVAAGLLAGQQRDSPVSYEDSRPSISDILEDRNRRNR